MGTPDESAWPGVSELPDHIQTFPQWRAKDLRQHLNSQLDPHGLDLLHRMLRYPPHERISAADALAHPYFADLADYQPGTRLPIPG